jgi:hypothetical protein
MSIVANITESFTTIAVLNFYRRLHNQSQASNKDYEYLLFGYYDGMDIKVAPSLGFLLDGEYCNDDGENLNQSYEIRQLCLYSRRVKEEELLDFLHNSSIDGPLLVVTEIKLNEKIMIAQKNALGEVAVLDMMEETITSNVDRIIHEREIPHIKYKIFFSLGYSEFVIIIRTDDFQDAVNLINDLRSCSYKASTSKSEYISLLRSTYSIVGVKISSIQQLPSTPVDLSLRFSLKKIIDIDEFKSLIINALQPEQDQITIRTIFGKYDLELELREFPINKFISIFHNFGQKTPQPILDPKDKVYKEFISRTDTRWLMNFNKYHGYRSITDLNCNKNIDGSIILADQFLRPSSIKLAYTQMLKEYYQIVVDEASEPSLVYELKDVIEFFSRQITEDHQRIVKKADSDEEEYIKHYESMELGLRLIMKLLETRVQAFRFFSEMPSYELQFIRTSTKVFIAYMALIEDIERDLKKIFQQQDNKLSHEITFFATLEHRDKVSSFDLFPETEYRLIPISMNHGSFFDIPYNILLLVHEICHYIPSPNRRERNKVLTELVCKHIAKRVVFMSLTGEYNLDVGNFELLEPELISQLCSTLSDFIMEQVWRDGKTIAHDVSIRLFPDSLSKQLSRSFSFLDDRVIECYETLTQHIEELGKQGSSNLPNNLQSIVEQQWRKVNCGDDLSSLQYLWNSILIQGSDKESDKRIFDQHTVEKLSDEWSELVKVAGERKKHLITIGSNFINDEWFKLIQRLIKNLKSKNNIYLLAHLTQLGMNENTIQNRERVSEAIVNFLNKPDVKLELVEHQSQLTKILFEARADYLMCQLINLPWKYYESMVDSYKNQIVYCSNEDGLQELEYRKAILRRTALYKDENILLDSEVDEYAEAMSLDDIAFYLDKLSTKDQFPTKQIQGKSIEYLRDYYHSISYDEDVVKIKNSAEFNIIERLWYLGMELFESRGQNVS